MINRCNFMLQDLKHFKTVIMSSYKSVQGVQGVKGVILLSFPHVLLTFATSPNF